MGRPSSHSQSEPQVSALSKVFSPIVMESLLDNHRSDYLREVLKNADAEDLASPGMTVCDFLDCVYRKLLAQYRCEYVYKNEIANRILLGKHSLNTAQMLTEVRVGGAKADVVILNGTSTAYEIKSEFDSMTRLENQLNWYSRTFEYVNVISPSHRARDIEQIVAPSVGVLALTARRTISTLRLPESNLERIEHDALFGLLRKNEYLHVIRTYYEDVPRVPNTRIHSECRKMFAEIPVREAHDLTMAAMGRRFDRESLQQHLEVIPVSMRAYAFSMSGCSRRIEALPELLSMPVELVVS